MSVGEYPQNMCGLPIVPIFLCMWILSNEVQFCAVSTLLLLPSAQSIEPAKATRRQVISKILKVKKSVTKKQTIKSGILCSAAGMNEMSPISF